MTPIGHYGYLTPWAIGPTGFPGAPPSTGGTAVIGVAQSSLPQAIQLNDGFHTKQGAPVAYITVAPTATPQQHAGSLLETATIDGGVIVCAFFTAGVVTLRRL